MGEPEARRILREEREKVKAERAEAVYEIRLAHRSLPDRATYLAEELRKAFADNDAVSPAARLQAAAVMVGLQMLADDLAIYERRVRAGIADELAKLAMPCSTHRKPAFDHRCAGCQRYTAVLDAARIARGGEDA